MALKGNFQWNKPEVYTAFVQGAEALRVYNSLKGSMANGMDYDAEAKLMTGSNPFAAARIDTLARQFGARVADLRDLSRPEVMKMVEGNHYTDAPILVLRSMEDGYEPNQSMIKQVAEAIEKANGRVELPAMITGFDVKTIKDKTGYGIALVPRKDFAVVQDERLSGSYDGRTFSNVDELGLPLFDSKGKRTWFAKSDGLSGLCLDRDLGLSSNWDGLAFSDSFGRVVLVSGEATSKNLEARTK